MAIEIKEYIGENNIKNSVDDNMLFPKSQRKKLKVVANAKKKTKKPAAKK